MIHNFLEISCLVVLLLIPFYLGAALINSFFTDLKFSLKLPSYFIASYSVIILSFFLLAFTQSLNLETAVFLNIFLAILTGVFFKKHRVFKTDLEYSLNWYRWLSKSKGRLLLSFIFVISFLVTVSQLLLLPQNSWDALTYHLFFPARWIQEQGFFNQQLPPSIESYAHFPYNAEILAVWLMLPFHSDLIANWMNIPFFLFSLSAFYALAREIGLNRNWALIAVAASSFSPMLYFELSTAYVEIAIYGFTLTSLLFLLIFYRSDCPKFLILSLLSLAIAFGIKPNVANIFLILVLTIFFLLAGKVLFQKQSLVRYLKPILVFLPILLILSSTWYLKNYYETKNPIYPFGLSIFGREIFQASEYKEQVVENLSLGTREQDLESLKRLFTYGTFPAITNAGPKFFFFILILLIGFSRIKSREYYYIVFISVFLISAHFLSNYPDLVAMRRNWTTLNARFLILPLNLLLLFGIKIAAETNERLTRIVLIFASFLDLFFLRFDLVDQAVFWVTFLIIISFCLLLGKALALFTRTQKIFASVILIFLLLLPSSLLSQLKSYRHQTRTENYLNIMSSTWLPTSQVPVWDFVNQLDRNFKINFLHKGTSTGQEWFFYPLLGENFQNKVYYLPLDPYDGDFAKWFATLEQNKIDLVVVAEPWTEELRYLEENKTAFIKEVDAQFVKVFKLKK